MLIKLVEVNLSTTQTSLRELYVNAHNIVSITSELRPNVIAEAKSLGLSNFTSFSTVVINEGASSRTITVAHSPDEINKKINSTKTLLKG